MDFTACATAFKGYHGSDEKRSLLINDEYYMLKISGALEEDDNLLKRSSSAAPSSEHIACEIFRSVGIPVQETILGSFEGKEAVTPNNFKT